MKVFNTFTKLVIVSLLISSLLASCNDENPIPDTTVSNEEAADIISSSLASNAQGLTFQITEASEATLILENEITNGRRPGEVADCGLDSTVVFQRNSTPGTNVEFDYAFSYKYMLSCSQFDIPSQLNFSFIQSGNADAPRFTSNISSEGSWSFTGLEPTAPTYELIGAYGREGSHTSKVRNQRSIIFNLEIELINLVLAKNDLQIQSGTAEFRMAGTTPEGEFDISGDLLYLGNDQIEITINEEVFIIELGSGDFVR